MDYTCNISQQSNQSSSCQSDHIPDDNAAALECNKAEIKSLEPAIATMQLINHLLQIWQNMSAEWQYKQVISITQRHFGTYMARADSNDYVHEAFAALMRVCSCGKSQYANCMSDNRPHGKARKEGMPKGIAAWCMSWVRCTTGVIII